MPPRPNDPPDAGHAFFLAKDIRLSKYIFMDLVQIHECLCDRTRLRIVHLLLDGPLCVCHLQEGLGEPQVKISRHLAYLRRRGMVAAERCGQWMIYRLPSDPPATLAAQLACLQDCCGEDRIFARDRTRLAKLVHGGGCPDCVGAPRTAGSRKTRRHSRHV